MHSETLIIAALIVSLALVGAAAAIRRQWRRSAIPSPGRDHQMERRRADQLLEMQKETLEYVAIGEPLPGILHRLAQEVSRQTGGCRVAFMLAADDGLLTLGASTSLPAGMKDELASIRTGAGSTTTYSSLASLSVIASPTPIAYSSAATCRSASEGVNPPDG